MLLASDALAYHKLYDFNFKMSGYRDNYVLPYYYTFSPYFQIYEGLTPGNQRLKNEEIKYQISFEIPIIGFIDNKYLLSIAYTQLSYWQFYARESQYFRSTDYEPEIFVTINHWFSSHDRFNIGLDHQSNGNGVPLERSWNRVYIDYGLHFGNFLMSLRIWSLIARTDSSDIHNPDITDFLGYGRLLLIYEFPHHIRTTLMFRSLKHPTYQVSLSFPIGIRLIRGYIQYFSGYGQSLLEYNHKTNAIGAGILVTL